MICPSELCHVIVNRGEENPISVSLAAMTHFRLAKSIDVCHDFVPTPFVRAVQDGRAAQRSY